MTNYHRNAYPEDELRPLSCTPLTRDRLNPAHVEVNDVLGNYSLSVVDSLSTLAILASSPTSDYDTYNALYDFQAYIQLLVYEYGDGSPGPAGQGKRARGFDLDSKVQVFETTIRGLGGLLSAHLFAIGELPIRGYHPVQEDQENGRHGILWHDGFVYDGQLLRLAQDLGERLLPAFHTPTGLPYPRVNLRHGTPFYENSPLNNDPEHGQCKKGRVPKGEREITETCSAGAGSLVLEFTVLGRLTGDARFERLAKRAFWAVWERRSASGLLGAGIDAETGTWIGHFTGIGAGIDSFFEYAFKSHVLLSGSHYDSDRWQEDSPESFLQTWQDAYSAITRHIRRDSQFQHPHYAQNDLWTGGPRLSWIDSLSAYYPGLLVLAGEVEEASTAHLLYTALWTRYGALPERWNAQTGAIENGLRWWGGRPEFIESTWYLYRATQDPWYLHVGEMTLRDIKRRCWTKCGWAGLQDVRTGEQTDRMESFFLGETAKYLYLLFDPEHPLNKLDAPFIFTTEGHPLIIPKAARTRSTSQPKHENNSTIRPWLSDNQCPLPPQPIPFSISATAARSDIFHAAALARLHLMPKKDTPGAPLLDFSADHPSVTMGDIASPNNYTYYPWTLPPYLIPANATSAKMAIRPTFDLTFPSLPSSTLDLSALQKVDGGILVNSISGLRFGMILEEAIDDGFDDAEETYRILSLSNLALGRDESLFLGAGTLSQVNPSDPHFTRIRDTEIVDLIIDAPAPPPVVLTSQSKPDDESKESGPNTTVADADWDLFDIMDFTVDLDPSLFSTNPSDDYDDAGVNTVAEQLLSQFPPNVLAQNAERLAEQLESLVGVLPDAAGVDQALRDASSKLRSGGSSSQAIDKVADVVDTGDTEGELRRYTVPALLATGIGAAPLPAGLDTASDPTTLELGALPYASILVMESDLCDVKPLPANVATSYNIMVVKRGDCSFSHKLSNIPSFAPSAKGLQLVVMVSFPEHEYQQHQSQNQDGESSENDDDVPESATTSAGTASGKFGGGGHVGARPLLDSKQRTARGVERRNGIAMVMVSGGDVVWETFLRAATAIATANTEGDVKVTVVEKKERKKEAKSGSKNKADSNKKDKKAAKAAKAEKKKTGVQKPGVGVKRRYYWSSQGVRISNLHMQ